VSKSQKANLTLKSHLYLLLPLKHNGFELFNKHMRKISPIAYSLDVVFRDDNDKNLVALIEIIYS
jgi:hypothetical protein